MHLAFTGVSLVSWLNQTVKGVQTREDGVRWANAMMEQEVFFSPDMSPFVDDHVPYIINLQHPVVGPEWQRIEQEETAAAEAEEVPAERVSNKPPPRRTGAAVGVRK